MVRKKKPALSSDALGVALGPSAPEETESLPPAPVEPPKTVKPVLEKTPTPTEPEPLSVGVKLEVYLRVSGYRLDQMAGFRRYALNHGLKQMQITDWRKEYEKFLSLPV